MRFHVTKDASKKNQIFEATFACIHEEGAKAVTIRSIAKRAAISQGLLHYYFKSKQALLSEFTQALLDDGVANLQEAVEAASSPVEKLEAFFKSGRDFVEKHGDRMIVIQEVWSLGIADPGLKKILRKHVEDLISITASIFAQGEKEKSFRKLGDEARTLHIIYHAFVLGMGVFMQLDRGFVHPRAFQLICEDLKKMALKGSKKNRPRGHGRHERSFVDESSE
jgi:AcrR family transcriptional regulator